ncbi:uncharacterized protein LOC131672055 [Phymastichus coffea]|uniref:uncharacterized protein LOC131672055 n=1 Tax=Phymastichus coffea TaxID=108790 RepID=UPI00273B90CF|nr:uncharacterized protein LOC131672055 [Phymastichus coffea]
MLCLPGEPVKMCIKSVVCEVQRLAEYERYLGQEARSLAQESSASSSGQVLQRAQLEGDLHRIQELFPNDNLRLHEQDVLTTKPKNVARKRNGANNAARLPRAASAKSLNCGPSQPAGKPSPARTFLLETPVQFTTGMQSQERHLFLFSDLLLIAKARSGGTFKLKQSIRMSELWLTANHIEDVAESNKSQETSFVLGWPTTNVVATFMTAAARDLWWGRLSELVREESLKEPPETNIQVVYHDSETNTEYCKKILVSSEMTAAGCVNLATRLLDLQGPFQLWARTCSEEAPYPLIGHERPFAVKLSNLRHKLSLEEGFDLEHCNKSGHDTCHFILRPILKSPAKKNKSKITGLLRRSLSLNPSVFGVNLSRLDENGLPKPVLVMLQQLFAKGPFTQGIFRKSANVRIVRELRDQIESSGESGCLEDAPIIAVAALLKDFLRSLPDPLLTSHLFPLWMASLESADPIKTIKSILDRLPKANYTLLSHLVCVLHHIARRSKHNLMCASNLGVCCGPSLLWSPSPTVNQSRAIPALTEMLIRHCEALFGEAVTQLFGEERSDSGAEESTDSLHSGGLSLDSLDLTEPPRKDHMSLSRDSGLTLSDCQSSSSGSSAPSPSPRSFCRASSARWTAASPVPFEFRSAVVAHAWLETVLDVIELLPVDIVKREILPIATSARQLSQSVNSRITCCRLLGKVATRLDAATASKDVLPTAQSLCQDVSDDVRACICLQLRFIGDSMAEDVVKLLPLLVQLAGDEESNVRQAAIQTIGHLLPRLKSDSVKDIVVPLIKVAAENAVKAEEDVICVISQEFGKIAQISKSYLTAADKSWFVEYFIQLAQIGTPSAANAEEKKPDFTFIGNSVQVNDRFVECRRSCAFNAPAMFQFASTLPENVDSLIPTFRNLASDSYFMVRRTIACGLHEVVKVLGSKSILIKAELIRLLKDSNEEVLQGLIPHVSEILDVLQQNQVIGADQTDASTIDLGRALIKCESEVSSTNNWRLSALMLNQLEILPKCFSSDFIYTYVVPIIRKRVLYSRPLPVRLAAGKTLLIFLRYNLKSQQRVDIRNQICTDFAHASSCYMRMIFIRMMIDATMIFSSMYFKEHFCSTLLSLMEDPVANVRLKVVTLVPTIKACLRLPADKKLLSTLETNVRNLMSNEKDRDVSAALTEAACQMDSIEVRVDSQPSPTKLGRYDSEDMKKYEEEKKIESMLGGANTTNVSNLIKKPNALKLPPTSRAPALTSGSESPVRPTVKPKGGESPKSSTPPSRPSLVRQMSTTTRQVPDLPKASTSSDILTTSSWSRFTCNSSQLGQQQQPWERAISSCHNITLTLTNPTYMMASDYSTGQQQQQHHHHHGAHCSCYELADRIFRTQAFSPEHHNNYSRSDSIHCSCLNGSNYLKTTNLFHTKHDYKFSDFTKSSLTSMRDDKNDMMQDSMFSRSSLANKYRSPDIGAFQSQYNPYWTFSSMPEIPVTLVDDEFMVDAGIRIPSQLGSNQSTSKIPNLEDIIYRNKKLTNTDRLRRSNTAFDKSKQFNFALRKGFSLDYEDPVSQPASMANNRDSSSSYSSQTSPEDRPKSSGIGSQNRARFGFEMQAQRKAMQEDKAKQRNSILVEKDRMKPLQPRNNIGEKSKRHSAGYAGVKLPESKETTNKLVKFKRHSIEVPDYHPDRNTSASRNIRRLNTLDVNHNQGLSKIPVRSIHVSGSRTAPVTRTSSPIRVDPELFQSVAYKSSEGFSQERRLRRFRSSDEEVDKLCQKF